MSSSKILFEKRRARTRRSLRNLRDGRVRLSVHRTLHHIYAQLIDDSKGITLCSASSNEKSLRDKNINGGNISGAEKIGALIGERAKEKGIGMVKFDRGGYRFHGRVKALADAARAAGLQF